MIGRVYRMLAGNVNYVQLHITGIMCCKLLCGVNDKTLYLFNVFVSITPHNIPKKRLFITFSVFYVYTTTGIRKSGSLPLNNRANASR